MRWKFEKQRKKFVTTGGNGLDYQISFLKKL